MPQARGSFFKLPAEKTPVIDQLQLHNCEDKRSRVGLRGSEIVSPSDLRKPKTFSCICQQAGTLVLLKLNCKFTKMQKNLTQCFINKVSISVFFLLFSWMDSVKIMKKNHSFTKTSYILTWGGFWQLFSALGEWKRRPTGARNECVALTELCRCSSCEDPSSRNSTRLKQAKWAGHHISSVLFLREVVESEHLVTGVIMLWVWIISCVLWRFLIFPQIGINSFLIWGAARFLL